METPLFTIEFAPEFGVHPVSFSTAKELMRWIANEKSQLGPYLNETSPLYRNETVGKGWHTKQTLDQLEGHCRGWNNAGDEQGKNLSLVHLKQEAANYKDGKAIPSTASVFGDMKAYQEMEFSHQIVTGYLSGVLGQFPINSRNEQQVGFVEGVIARRRVLPLGEGAIERVEAAAKESELTVAKLHEVLALQSTATAQAQAGWSATSDAIETERSSYELSHAEKLEALDHVHTGKLALLDNQIAAQVEKCKTELNEFRARIETDISMGEPIQYWNGKADQHHRWFIGSFIGFVAAAGVMVGVVSVRGESLMKDIESHQKEMKRLSVAIPPPTTKVDASATALQQAPTAPSTPPSSDEVTTLSGLHFLRLGILLLIATVGVWCLRFLARILLSNLHLKDDARERVVMLKTFQALLESKLVIANEDLKMALGSIFRPATSGLVKDDGVPPGVWDVVTRLKGGGGGSSS